jgi:hypothetical protein
VQVRQVPAGRPCERERIPFVLGHALAINAIYGGQAMNDRLDAVA